MKKEEQILIIGGGITGLFCAYYLVREGFPVTIVEKEEIEIGCSMGNAGMIVPSHFIPLAAPGVVKKGLKWMLDGESPFYIRPRLNMDLLRWGLQFIRSSNARHVDQSASVLRDLNLESKKLYREFRESGFDFGLEEKGILMLYKTSMGEEDEGKTAEFANELGVEAKMLSSREVEEMNPGIEMDVLGAAYYPQDAHLYPNILVAKLKEFLENSGVRILEHTRVLDFHHQEGHIKQVSTSAGEIKADQVVVAAGSWSGLIARKLGIYLPMQGGKGYSVMMEDEAYASMIPAILTEAKVTLTPMGGSLRIGGTLEIAGMDESVNMRRVKGLLESVPHYYPGIRPQLPEAATEVWRGLRPCSPDGLPYLGYTTKFNNLLFATGHAMMGVSLGPVTGKIISNLILGRPVPVPIDLLRAERFA